MLRYECQFVMQMSGNLEKIEIFHFEAEPCSVLMLQRGAYQTNEERMRTVRAALELGMILYADIKIIFRYFYRLYDITVR